MARMSSASSFSILPISWLVRKPSKKWMNGTLAASVAAWAISAISITSWGAPLHNKAQPVARVAMTSL